MCNKLVAGGTYWKNKTNSNRPKTVLAILDRLLLNTINCTKELQLQYNFYFYLIKLSKASYNFICNLNEIVNIQINVLRAY